MIEMPPLQFARGERDSHGLLRSRAEDRQAAGRAVPWLAGAGVLLAAPDQGPERGRHPGDRAGPARLWRDRPARAGRGLRHGASDRRSRRPARSSQDRQGDLRRPRLGRLRRLADAAAPSRSRRRRRRGQHPACDRAPADPIELLRKRYGDQMYIVQFQNPAREPDKIFGSRVEQTFDAFMRKPVPRRETRRRAAGRGHRRFAQAQSGVSADDRGLRRQARSAHADPVAEEKKVFVDTFTKTGFTGGINWYRNLSRNWQRRRGSTIPSGCRR